MSDTNYIIGDTPEDLNRVHNVTLKEGQISTILYVLEGYIQGSDDYHFDDNFKEDVDNIFERLEGVINKYYNQQERIKEQLEWYNSAEKVTQTQLKSIKGNLLWTRQLSQNKITSKATSMMHSLLNKNRKISSIVINLIVQFTTTKLQWNSLLSRVMFINKPVEV